jgi:phage shock protein PspC (stress-responsive transcriptional regulator)
MEPKKLFRSKNKKMIAGVCAGLADYFNVDINIIRVLFIFVTFFWGASILLYLIMWLIIPLNTKENNEIATTKANNSFLLMLGIVLVIIGVLALIPISFLSHFLSFKIKIVPFFQVLSALAFIALGLYVISGYLKKENSENSDQKVLSRSITNKKFLGVCAGIAEYFKIDPTVVRVVWILFSFISFGIAVIVYFVLGIILPNEQVVKRSV